jgi:hypothetical protein
MVPFLLANDREEKIYAVKYILRREFHMSTEDIMNTEYTELLYYIDRFIKEQEAIKQSMANQR